MNTLENNIKRLEAITDRSKLREVKQLALLNKLRKMNNKQTVNSFSEHRELKAKNL